MRTVHAVNTETHTPSPPSTPPLLTVPQVCEQLRVAPSTLYKWWRTGKGPRKVPLPNGQFRVRQEWLDDYLLALELGVAA